MQNYIRKNMIGDFDGLRDFIGCDCRKYFVNSNPNNDKPILNQLDTSPLVYTIVWFILFLVSGNGAVMQNRP